MRIDAPQAGQRRRTGRKMRSRSGRGRIDRRAIENLLASRFPAKVNSQPALPFQKKMESEV
jgi:hypothetical protein